MSRTLPCLDGRELPVGKILAVGRNYAAHAAEMNAPAEPVVFLKPPTALVRPGEPVPLPRDRGSVHHELEILVWLSEGGSHLDPAAAARCVGAYGLGLDLTLRDVQAQAKQSGGPWTLAKGFDGSLPVSSLVPASAVPDPSRLTFALTNRGAPLQRGRASDMMRDAPRLISWISTWITWEPGDLLLTGTPEGVGPVSPGDTVVMTLDGHLESTVRFV